VSFYTAADACCVRRLCGRQAQRMQLGITYNRVTLISSRCRIRFSSRWLLAGPQMAIDLLWALPTARHMQLRGCPTWQA
jgi:hypothetical protein